MTAFHPRGLLGLILMVSVFSLSPAPAQAGILWYNGDYDNRDSLTAENGVPINVGGAYTLQKSLVYDNFVVPVGQTWTLSSVFANFQMSYYVAPTTATWEIRRGVSAGVGGTLVASGDTAATVTALTAIPGYYYGDTEDQVSASVTGVTLTAGIYYLAVVPDSAGYYGDQAYLETTSGTNAVGTPPGNDGNSFYSSNAPGNVVSFISAATELPGDGTVDFAMGVNGTFAIPEPSSFALIVVGLLGSSIFLRSRAPGRGV